MKMIKIAIASTAIVSLSTTLAFAQAADGLSFNQGTRNINEVILEQTTDGSDALELNISGDMTSVVIKQSGTSGSASGNDAVVNIYSSTDVTSVATLTSASTVGDSLITGATRLAGWKTFSATFDGNDNILTFDLGTTAVTSAAPGYDEIFVDLAVNGNRNDLTHTITSGLAGETLQLGGIVVGDDNAVVSTIGAVGTVAFNYDIQGDSNSLTATLSGATGGRAVNVALTGDSNAWIVTSGATGATLDVTATGNTITGTNTQSGANANLELVINKPLDGAFAVTTTQSGATNVADVTINAVGAGAFTLTQSSALASYTGTLNIAAGGAVTITQ
jgi:hypothetical protein